MFIIIMHASNLQKSWTRNPTFSIFFHSLSVCKHFFYQIRDKNKNERNKDIYKHKLDLVRSLSEANYFSIGLFETSLPTRALHTETRLLNMGRNV
jgi:hypothetical protein